MKKSLKKQGEKERRGLVLERETILTLSDPLLELALGGGPVMPTESFTQTGNS